MRDLERLSELRKSVVSHERALVDIFHNARREINADNGFLAFEDSSGYLSIVASRGDYWHLPANVGSTGLAMQTCKPTITDPHADAHFRDTDTSVYSEIIVPIVWKEETVGVLLFDNLKTVAFQSEVHLPILVHYAGRITELLDARDPWCFRAWWVQHLEARRVALAHYLAQGLRTITRNATHVETAVEFLTREGILQLYERFSSGGSPTLGEDVVTTAIQQRRIVQQQAECPTYQLVVPFPNKGPLLGLVSIRSREIFPKDLAESIVRLVDAAPDDPLLPSTGKAAATSERFFDMIVLGLAARPWNSNLSSVLEQVSRISSHLCDSPVRVFYLGSQSESDDDGDTSARAVSDEEIHRGFAVEGQVQAKSFVRGDLIRCPVLVEDELFGGVDVVMKDHLSDTYNREIIETTAELIARIIDTYRRFASISLRRSKRP